MANRELPQRITTGEASRRLSGILRSFRESPPSAVPVVFGSLRRAEAIIVPFDQFDALLSSVEDRAIAPVVAARIAARGGRPFNELRNDLGMCDGTISTAPHPLE